MIVIWGKHAPHIKTFNHSGYGWAVEFHCGHSRFVPNEKSISLHEQKVLPVCDVVNCSGWPKPGEPLLTLERWTEHGQPRCPSVSPVTDRHQCRLALGHARGHVSDCLKFEWADKDTARDDRHRQASADLASLANGDRLGPDATNNARIVQDRINRMRYPLGTFYTDEKGHPDGGARVDAIVERQKFEASVTESLVRLERRINELAANLVTRKASAAQADERLKALTQHVTNLEHGFAQQTAALKAEIEHTKKAAISLITTWRS